MPGKYDHIIVDKIPEARELLRKLARELRQRGDIAAANEILEIVPLMIRSQQAKPTARPRQVKIDGAKVQDILDDLKEHPNTHCRIIGRRHGVDGGRVSEIAQGLRTPESPSIKRPKK